MLKILDNLAFFNDDIDLDNIDSDIVTYFGDDMDINTTEFNNIKLDDDDNDDDLQAMILVEFMAWCFEYKKRKAFKKELSEELMRVAWHTTKCWDWCVPED